MRVIFALAIFIGLMPQISAAFERVKDRTEFLSLVSGKELRIGLYNLTLRVSPDGKIDGSALGWGITGEWSWNDGYFCRRMDWSGYDIDYNCQLVEARDGVLRFTSDKGAGMDASFRLR